jgi:glyoxylase I family protein
MLRRPVPMQLAGVHHLALKARDPVALARFYREVLGLQETTVHRDERGVRAVWLAAGAAILMVERSEAEPRAELPGAFEHDPPGWHLLAFAIPAEDREGWRARLEGAGAAVVRQSAFTLYALDPEGNRFGLSSWPVRSDGA